MAQICAMTQISSLPPVGRPIRPGRRLRLTRLAISLLIGDPDRGGHVGGDRGHAAGAARFRRRPLCRLAPLYRDDVFARLLDDRARANDRPLRHRPALVISAVSFGRGVCLAGYAPNLTVFTAAHVLIGIGAGTGFGPMMADISHWFVKRRGLAVVIVASGNYLAGTIWPLLMSLAIPLIGWRATYAGLGIVVAAAVLPLALTIRRRPAAAVYAQAEAATEAARADVGVSPRLLLILLARRGLFLLRGDVDAAGPSRRLLRRSWLWRRARRRDAVADDGSWASSRASAPASSPTPSAARRRCSSARSCKAWRFCFISISTGSTSLFVVSGIFGLFQGGIVPMYAVICRELLPPRRGGRGDRPRRLGDDLRHGVRRLFFRRDLRPDQLLPDGVLERGLVERAQSRHRRLAVLAAAGGTSRSASWRPSNPDCVGRRGARPLAKRLKNHVAQRR